MLGLYVHIPFCASICSYCNFNRGLFDRDLKARFLQALEIEMRATPGQPAADTLFFGGGTPSILEPAEIARLIDVIRDVTRLTPNAEITLETNPETAVPERLAGFRDAGVNRISFGVQSFDDRELARLGRTHSAMRAKDAVRAARAAGFRNLSFDLMFWLPGQTPESWRRTIDQAIELEPDHLSLYLLELYPNAPLKESMARAEPGPHVGPHPPRLRPDAASLKPRADWAQSSDDEAADMYLEALERLDAVGLEQYEISNVARPGYRSHHNVKYWQGGAWRGYGCGAHSTVGDVRWKNVPGTLEYATRLAQGQPVALDMQRLTEEERLGEALFTGLRLTDGIDERNFVTRFGVDPWSRYRDMLDVYHDAGYLWRRSGAFGLTRRGMLVANEIMAVFV